MLQRVSIASLLLGLAVIASTAIARQATPGPFQLTFDSARKVPYRVALMKELVADAKAHGDARRGAAVFHAATSACLSCHKVGKQGGEVGPNLTAVGACIPPEEIVEGVFWPNRTVKPGFNAIAVELANGRLLQGIVKDETSRELVLQDAAGKQHRIPKKEIEERREIGSLMPEGLTAAMTAEQRRDLIRYLLDLGKTRGLDDFSHEPAKFLYNRGPMRPEDWPNRTHSVNRDRVYDFYTREALHFRSQRPLPLLLPQWPGLDGGTFGHWGNQNDDVWRDARWNQTDLGSLQCGVFRAGHDDLLPDAAESGAVSLSLHVSGSLDGDERRDARGVTSYPGAAEHQIVIPVPALVSEALFEAAAAQVVVNRPRSRQQRRGPGYLLQGLLECACGGYAYYGKGATRFALNPKAPYPYYRCAGTDACRFAGTCVCQSKPIRLDRLDAAVWADVGDVLQNPLDLQRELERRLCGGAEPDVNLGQIRKQVAAVQRSISRLIDA